MCDVDRQSLVGLGSERLVPPDNDLVIHIARVKIGFLSKTNVRSLDSGRCETKVQRMLHKVTTVRLIVFRLVETLRHT